MGDHPIYLSRATKAQWTQEPRCQEGNYHDIKSQSHYFKGKIIMDLMMTNNKELSAMRKKSYYWSHTQACKWRSAVYRRNGEALTAVCQVICLLGKPRRNITIGDFTLPRLMFANICIEPQCLKDYQKFIRMSNAKFCFFSNLLLVLVPEVSELRKEDLA